MNQWLVSMTAGPWQLTGIQMAQELGYKVLGIDGNKDASGFCICDSSLVVDINYKESLLSVIRDFFKEHNCKPSGVFSYCSEAGMLPAAWISEEFKLSGLRPDDVQKVLFKHVQRSIWRETGTEDLKWFISERVEDALLKIETIGFPCVVKPVDSSGSRGVSKVIKSTEFKDAYLKASQASRMALVLVEEYLDGVEYTVEAFTNESVTKILVVTEKYKVEGSRGTVACELAYPSISDDLIEKIKIKVLRAIKALNYHNGPTHTEVILTNSGRVGLVEMAGRGGGFGLFSKLIPMASGVDVTRLLLKQAIGESVDLSNVNILRNKFSLKFIPVTKKGTVISISGIYEANRIENVEVGSYVRIGEKVDDEFCDGNRMGYMLISGSSLIDIQGKIGSVESLVKFEVL